MTNALEFRSNAQICDELAHAAKVCEEQKSWLEMKSGWLVRAAKEEESPDRALEASVLKGPSRDRS